MIFINNNNYIYIHITNYWIQFLEDSDTKQTKNKQDLCVGE